MTLIELVYVSSATRDITEEQLKTILTESRDRNAKLDISGVLLYHDGTFFQYLEGAPEAVEQIFRSIGASSLHSGIIELARGPIDHRNFAEWSMGFTHCPEEQILRLAKSSWKAIEPAALGQSGSSEGLELLRNFWNLNKSK